MKTVKFLAKSLKENVCILFEEQKWWLAVSVLLVTIVLSLVGTLVTGLNSNANGIMTTSTETCFDKGVARFAESLNDTDDIIITDGVLVGKGAYQGQSISATQASEKIYTPNMTFTHLVQDTSSSSSSTSLDQGSLTYITKDILNVFVFTDLDPANSNSDATIINTFLATSVYKNDTSSVATWDPCSFIIFTKTSIHISVYKALKSASTDKAVSSTSGRLANITLDLKTLAHQENGDLLIESDINQNFLNLVNTAYDSVKITTTWMQVGLYALINLGAILLAGVIFWIVMRNKKETPMKYTFWRSQKVVYFESLTPAIIALAVSFIAPTYGSFALIICIAFRLSSSISKITGGNRKDESKPVYKARS